MHIDILPCISLPYPGTCTCSVSFHNHHRTGTMQQGPYRILRTHRIHAKAALMRFHRTGHHLLMCMH